MSRLVTCNRAGPQGTIVLTTTAAQRCPHNKGDFIMTLNRYEQIGTLSDGTPIDGMIDTIRPDVCTGVVWADNDEWHLTAQNDPDLFFIIGKNIQLEELTIEQVNRLRALLNTDIPEQMIAAATAYGQGEAAPNTFAETAQTPECQALFDRLSPAAQRVAGRLIKYLDRQPSLDAVEQTLDHISAVAASERPAPLDDDPVFRVIDDGQKSGIRVERADRPFGDRAWLDFTAGDVQISADILGGRPGVGLVIYGESLNEGIDDVLTLDDVRQLHADLGRILADERLLGALAEQEERTAAA
jgi:hypothetical protein